MSSARRARIIQAIRSNLADMLLRDVQDLRLKRAGVVTISQVELNRDMSVAIVYVSFFVESEDAIVSGMRALDGLAGKLRGPLGRRMNLARAPKLKFVLDTSAEFNERLSSVLREDEQKRASADSVYGEDSGDEQGEAS